MLRSMYSGISGLKNHQTKLDVIGNNISNVNTYGFKKGRVVFKDLISQTTAGASAPTATRGGVNPKQVGLGSQLAAIDTIHGTGALQTTSRTLDLAISGDGFFQVADSNLNQTGFVNTQYTRAGNFYMDRDGFLVNSDGKYLVGFAADIIQGTAALTEFTTEPAGAHVNDKTDALYLINYDVNPPERMNSSGGSEATISNGLRIQGNQLFVGDPNSPTGPLSVHDTLGANTLTINVATGTLSFTKGTDTYELTLDANDKLIAVNTNDATDILDLEDTSITAANITANKNLYDAVQKSFKQVGTINVFSSTLSNVQRPIQIPTTAQSMSIGQDGTINFVDENGELQVAGQIQLAKFPNTGGLEKVGSNYYQETSNSGAPVVGFATEMGIGSIESGFLEMSNVDLSEEFTEMIVAQRGFQANSRIITTSDQILEELVNLKR